MTDYKELYFELFRASEQAVRVLIDAQRLCEERILSDGEQAAENGVDGN